MRQESEYSRLLQTMVIDNAVAPTVKVVLERLTQQKTSYMGYGTIPWELIATVHMMEASGDLDKQILNGEPWNRETKLVPRGLGPFKSFRDATEKAIELKFPRYTVQWTLPFCLFFMEQWNGWGYYKRGVQSLYLWAGSNHGVGVGKFVADGKYDPNAKSSQLGAALILTQLMRIAEKPTATTQIYYDPSGGLMNAQGEQVADLQAFLNRLSRDEPQLICDGKAGPKTDARFFSIFGSHLLGYAGEKKD